MPKWTDADLLRQDFTLAGRPDDQDAGLSTEKPPTGAAIRFTQDYNITPPLGVPNRSKVQPFVWCCLCQEPTHWVGWVAEYDVGNGMVRCLIGKDCATRKGGEIVRHAATDYEIRRRRAEVLRIRQTVLPMLTPVRAALETWGASPGVGVVDDWRAQLRNLADDFYKAIEGAAKASPPVLLIEREVRDHAAETNRTLRRGKDYGPIYKIQFEQAGRVEGASLYAAASAAVTIRRLVEKFDTAAAALRRPTDGVRVQDIEASLRLIREVAEGAVDLQRRYVNYEKGLEVGAVAVLVKWFNAQPKRGYGDNTVRQDGRRLTVERSWGARTAATIPDAAPIVVPEIIAHLRAALLGRDAEEVAKAAA